MSRIYSIILSLAALVVTLDQGTKQLALETFTREGESRPFLSWFHFTLVYNYGAAFGILRNLPESIRVIFFSVLPIVVIAVLWFAYVRKFRTTERLGPIAIGLVVGGALGNLIDRLRHGYVVDFIDWFYRSDKECIRFFYPFTTGTCHWPVFNIADAAITIAMFLLVFHSAQDPKAKTM